MNKRMTRAQVNAEICAMIEADARRKKSYNKYHAKRTTIDGITFDSRKEANYYCELKLLKSAGIIKDIQLQPRFRLQDGFRRNGMAYRPIDYVADFLITFRDGKQKVVDVKGTKTDVYMMKKKMLLYKYPNIDFEEA